MIRNYRQLIHHEILFDHAVVRGLARETFHGTGRSVDQSTGREHLEREIAELRRKLMEGKRSRLWQ
jgi:hypothetical protein